MRFLVAIFLVLTSTSFAYAQEITVEVLQRLVIEAPQDYDTTFNSVNWSPDSSLIAVKFQQFDRSRRPIADLWEIYDVQTGELLYNFAVLIGWYADSSHLLIRSESDAPATVVNARTGAVAFVLAQSGATFNNGPFDHMIANLDEANNLRIYNAQTGNVDFMLNGVTVTDLPLYTPDGARFAVNTVAGIYVYDAATYILIDHLTGYRFGTTEEGQWSPDGRRLIVVPLDSLTSWLGPRQIWTISESLSAPIYNATGVLVWSSDSRQIAGASDHTKVRLFEAVSGSVLETLRDFPGRDIKLLEWEAHYLFIMSGNASFVRPTLNVWDLERRRVVYQDDSIGFDFEHAIEGTSLEIFQQFTGLRKIDLTNGDITYADHFEELLRSPSPNRQWILDDGATFEVGVPAPIYFYQREPFELVATLEGHTEIVNFLWSPDSRYFASVGEPNTIIVWEIIEPEA